MISDDKGLPTSLAGLFNVAAALYVRRIGLYGGLALIALAVQYVVGVLLPHTTGLVTGLAIVLDALLVATVSIGVAFDVARKPADWSTVLMGASERWGVVTIVIVAYYFTVLAFGSSVFGPPDQTLYGFLILPIVVLWGAISLAQVIAAIEPVKSRLTLPFHALGKGMAVGFRAGNLGRLAILSIVLVLPALASGALAAQFAHQHLHDVEFWAYVPLDALVTGPLQALTTVFYIDFLRRAKR